MKYLYDNLQILNDVVFLVTNEFKLVYKIMKLDIGSIEIIHQPNICDIEQSSLVITDQSVNNSNYTVIKVHKNEPILRIKRKILKAVQSGSTKPLVIGVDPGNSIGLAILEGEELLATNLVISVRASIDWIRKQIDLLKAKRIILKIGDGMKSHLDELLLRYDRELKNFNVKIEVVDESYSSIKTTNKVTIHEQAAVIIAKREGIRYTGRN